MDNMAWRTGIIGALSDDAFVDFHLVGTDNVEVRCNKQLLAMQSPVFKEFFYGGSNAQESDRIHLHYHSSIIQVVVNYCHSGNVELSFILGENETTITRAEVGRLADLREFGRYLQLEKISFHVEKELGDAVFRKQDSGRVCSAVLEELLTRGEDDGAFWDVLFQYALENPLDCLVARIMMMDRAVSKITRIHKC